MTIIKDFTSVTAIDKKFTEIIKKIEETAKDYFYVYIDDLGLECNLLSDYLCNYGELYEDTNEDLYFIYPANKRMVKNLIAWLENYDIINVVNNKCCIDTSNEPIIAQLLNQLLDIVDIK